MREKIYFHHISHVVVSFLVFFLTGYSATLLVNAFSSFSDGVAELLVFLFASSCGVLMFRAFEHIVPAPVETAAPHPVMQGRFKRRPFSMRRYVLEAIPHTIITTALLVLAMYLVTFAFDSDGDLVSAPLHTPDVFAHFSLLVFHPLVEEYLFRGLFYGKLRAMSPIFACLMQAVMFAIAHNGVDGMMYALIAGIIMGVAAEGSNGIAVPVVAHILINLRTLLCSLMPEGTLHFTIDGILIVAGVISWGILWVTSRRLPTYAKREYARVEREEADFDD